MSKSFNIGIIGGGLSGLALGYYLARLNFKVTIFEKEKNLGGLLSAFDIDKTGKIKLEKYYHHNFPGDRYILEFGRTEKATHPEASQTPLAVRVSNSGF